MEQEKENRRTRINRLKKAIVLLATGAWMIPLVLCLMLFGFTFSNQKMWEKQNLLLQEMLQTQRQLEERYDAIEKKLMDLEKGLTLTGEGRVEEAQAPGMSVGEEVSPKEPEEPSEQLKRIYLTFDDGPSVYTGDILDVLKEYDVKATFFVNGKEGEWADEALKRIVEEGHTLGMHSYSHQYDQVYRSVEDFAADYEMLHEHIYKLTGYDSRVYRFPGGSSNTISKIDIREFGKYLEERETTYYDWNISSKDASKVPLSVESIVRNCTMDLDKYDDCMILCHDAKSKATTVEALPIVIERIMEMENVEFLPITESTPLIQHISLYEDN